MKIKEIYDAMTYGPAPENADEAFQFLDEHIRKFNLFIDGNGISLRQRNILIV